MNLPKAKTENIVVQDLDSELLVYNLTTHRAYTLNETSKIVFNRCDGKTTFADLRRKYKFTDDLILFALDELKASDLLIDYQTEGFPGLSRREVIRKVGAASLIALPVIAGMTAPTAIQAASTCTGQSCNETAPCAAPCTTCTGSGTCSAGGGTCSPIGTPCFGTVIGTCNYGYICSEVGGVCTGPGGCGATGTGTCTLSPFGTCSVGGTFCFATSTCTGFATGTCNGTGTCA